MKPKLSTVIFDYGGVLGLPLDPEREAAMMDLTHLHGAEFYAAYRKDRIELDRGTLDTDEYWRRLYVAGGVEATPGLLAQIEREDALGWSRVNQSVVDWSYELRQAGYLTAILSNMPSQKLRFMRADGGFTWIKDFDVTVFSCDYLLVKPEPAIYRLCLQKLGVSPQECIFLDDVPENAEGARAVGIHAMVFGSADKAAAELERDWALPVGKLRNGGVLRTEASG
ncbi:MAG TPA: HAD family phosphatase [Spirochaetia bacterium]|nr:HAD family phosphatase [Spirochaetia bacterium]